MLQEILTFFKKKEYNTRGTWKSTKKQRMLERVWIKANKIFISKTNELVFKMISKIYKPLIKKTENGDVQFSSVTESCPTLCDHINHSMPGLPVHQQLPELTQTHVAESVMPSSHLILWRSLLLPQSFPASGSFQMSQLFAWGGQSIGVSASTSVLPMNIQDWSPL